MAFSLKNIIWGLFGPSEELKDTIRDVNGKGIRRRYNEIMGEDFDDHVLPYIDDLLANTLISKTVLMKVLPLLEDSMGGRPVVIADEVKRRRIMRFLIRFRQVAGSRRGFEMLFNMVGMSCVVNEDFAFYSFDSTTFDDPIRKFDMSVCKQYCTEFRLTIGGTLGLDDALRSIITQIIEANRPINARLKSYVYSTSGGTFSLDFSNQYNSMYIFH